MTFCLAIDALIVGVDTQNRYLGNKKTWTRKVVLITDGESPIEVEDWEVTVKRMDELNIDLKVVYVAYSSCCYFVLTFTWYQGCGL